jgi:hypothetical protein
VLCVAANGCCLNVFKLVSALLLALTLLLPLELVASRASVGITPTLELSNCAVTANGGQMICFAQGETRGRLLQML